MSLKSNSSLKKHYDVIIVGGGIVGAGILRDLALHDVECLLTEKYSFGSQTSSSSSKMLHGGIRYLENMDFNLVFEALHEKNLWLKLAPNLAHEESFYMPVFKESKRPLWMLKIGLFLYDFLSGFQNSPHKIASKKETLTKLTGIKKENLKGSGVYYDAVVDDLKLTTENIKDAIKIGPVFAHENMEFLNFNRINNDLINCTFKNHEKTIEISCSDLVFATGPFTDRILKTQKQINWSDKLIPSKGSHLWIKKETLKINSPMVITTKDNRIVFVIPHDDKILVGTTEVNFDKEFDFVKPSQDEINYLIKCLQHYFPDNSIDHDCIISSFAGIRPLVKEGTGTDKSKTAREHKVFMPFSNLFVIVGGKLTTFRVMGQEIVRSILLKRMKSYNPNKTKIPFFENSRK